MMKRLILAICLAMVSFLLSSSTAFAQCSPSTFPGWTPPDGCFCKSTWSYNGKTICNSECAAPDGDAQPWCYTTAACAGKNWAYCTATSSTRCETRNPFSSYAPPGCTCKSSWSYNGRTYCGSQCGNPDNDPNGPWCFTNGSCNGQSFAYCQPVSVPTPTPTATPTPPPHVDCTSGSCCDTTTQRFKPAGTVCVTAKNDCTSDATCDGSSAGCPPSVPEPDGTICASGGSGAQCFRGTCVGTLDAQCAKAFAAYAGTFVAEAKNGVAATCGNEQCGILKCTNTAWNNYCFDYTCAAGYTCTVGSRTVTGPAIVPTCNCITTERPAGSLIPSAETYVADGTPCGGSGEDRICLNHTCVARPASDDPPSGFEPSTSEPPPASDDVVEIRGLVADRTSTPVQGVAVYLTQSDGTRVLTHTDEAGQYVITVPKGASFKLRFERSDLKFDQPVVEGQADQSQSQLVVATVAAEVPETCSTENLTDRLIAVYGDAVGLHRLGKEAAAVIQRSARDKGGVKAATRKAKLLTRNVDRLFASLVRSSSKLPEISHHCSTDERCRTVKNAANLAEYRSTSRALRDEIIEALRGVGGTAAKRREASELQAKIASGLAEFPKTVRICRK